MLSLELKLLILLTNFKNTMLSLEPTQEKIRKQLKSYFKNTMLSLELFSIDTISNVEVEFQKHYVKFRTFSRRCVTCPDTVISKTPC